MSNHHPETCDECKKWSTIICIQCNVNIRLEKNRWIDHTLITLRGDYNEKERLNHAALCFNRVDVVKGAGTANTDTQYDHKPDPLVALVITSE